MLEVATCQEYSEALSNGYVPLDASAQKTEKPSEPLPSSLTSRIPHEMFDTIIAFESADRGALETFTLVSHAWDASSRHHLFSHFKRILKSIRTVDLTCAGDSPTEEETIQLEEVLPKMVNICSLDVSWPSTPAHVALVARILKAEAWIKVVRFWDENYFSSFRIFQATVAKFAALEVLEVFYPEYGTESDEALVQGDWHGGVTKVGTGTIDILRWIAAAVGTIRSLDVGHLEYRHLGIMSKFIFLEHLSLAFTQDSSFAATDLGMYSSIPYRLGMVTVDSPLTNVICNPPRPQSRHPPRNHPILEQFYPFLQLHGFTFQRLIPALRSQCQSLYWGTRAIFLGFRIRDELENVQYLLQTSRSYAKLDELQIEVHGPDSSRRGFSQDGVARNAADFKYNRIAREGVEGLCPGARLTVTGVKL
ncbi:hypothetical protein DFP72DRAFT_1175162 [Ephemerocybe angulata]|uniref:Uncharacterized protein n=1 Tax=Ephemerocybe angulata TaxID=980116 RepID=A0A8H6M0E3_9AGAR|nr:hypothetical protein DFP72DRAFT_1175162 [Tulosesus angulatus]